MSGKEVPRAGLVKAALAGRITNAEGARALQLSVRQFRVSSSGCGPRGCGDCGIAAAAARRPTAWRPASSSRSSR
jgi:hypothetical protein